MPGVTERTLAVLEFLATQMEGTPAHPVRRNSGREALRTK